MQIGRGKGGELQLEGGDKADRQLRRERAHQAGEARRHRDLRAIAAPQPQVAQQALQGRRHQALLRRQLPRRQRLALQAAPGAAL